MYNYYLVIVLSPLIAAIIAGLFGRQIGRTASHSITILAVGISTVCSMLVLYRMLLGTALPENISIYTWFAMDGLRIEIGFLVDRLTAFMMVVVTFVSLMVHVYTIGYMRDDPGYQRFFSHISLFTFAMLMLVMANNFLQLFFGWEAVGLVSYLLIGFWLKRPTAVFASLKAFLVNRVGDFGFILGIAAVAYFAQSLDYAEVFASADQIAGQGISVWPGTSWNAMTLICVLLFIGAMGKSAQAPLHVWLPDSMEGPTPISALIHAATMVTAGIFLVARMSPLYELSLPALGTVVIIGAFTAFFMGLLGIVQNDIKRVIAYSTLSQLGYMTVALGASAYSAAMFHLMTHAFFKALLFLAAGSVIIALHHEQDMRKMGGLKKYMPITYWTALVGSLALIGFPGTAGFFSKDLLIEAVRDSHWAETDPWVYWIAYLSVLLGVFVTALYTFRMFFMVFHGEERMDKEARSHVHESPWVVTVPLIMLAIPSAIIGWWTIEPVLFGNYFGDAIVVNQSRDVLAHLGEAWHGRLGLLLHAWQSPVLWLAVGGVVLAWYLYLKRTDLPGKISKRFSSLYKLLDRKYYFDDLWINGFAAGGRRLSTFLWEKSDQGLIDGFMVNGTTNAIGRIAGVMRQLQTGYLYTYAFAMIIGLTAILGWLTWLR
ncbi:MAG TPA: NADH-quinone oxidoreductase subunit L [Woeseiaceae bacterium]|nr:NADH-quinone oxidoreductase subunit L [Woeseiaceae bacterium]